MFIYIIGGKYLISVQNYKKTFSNLKISDVDLSKISDGKYIGSYDTLYVGAEVIPDMVLKAQNLQVDTISRATDSSKSILKAIENALVSGES